MARKKKAPTPPPPPSIYVASVTDRGAGRLHGVWIDATQPIETMHEAIDEMLASSSVLGAMRWSIDDSDNFAGITIHPDERLERVGELAAGVAKHGPPFAAWLEHFTVDPAGPELVAQFDAVYLGEHWSIAGPIDDRDLWTEFRRIVWSCCSPTMRIAISLDLERLADFYVRKGDIVELPGCPGCSACPNATRVTMYDERFGWLPPEGIHLTTVEVAMVVEALWALYDGTDRVEPNRAHTVTVLAVVARALAREEEG